jgi:tricorn protease
VAEPGYYRHPTISGGKVVFVAEDDLWQVEASGGIAHRLTANPGLHAGPRFDPGGRLLAFTSRDEGRMELHLMDAEGGPSRRLTYFGAFTQVVGWQGARVVVASDHRQPFAGWTHLYGVPTDGSPPEPLRLGPATAIAFGRKGTVLARNGFDPSRWKRYRGGRAGRLWIDRGQGFVPLVDLAGNMASPMWVGDRVYFLSDHEGVGNIYSVTAAGRGILRHTHHEAFYARFPSTDGSRIVYHCGGDLWLLDPAGGAPERLEVKLPSARPQRNRRFVAASRHLETIDLHPEGHSLLVTARGSTFSMPLWEGAAHRHDPGSATRERLASWLPDGTRMVAVSDQEGDERLIVRNLDDGSVTVVPRDLGRIRSLDVAPSGPARVAVTNHRHEAIIVDLSRNTARVVHKSPHSWIAGTAWSPDGKWLALAAATTRTTCSILLYEVATRKLHQVGPAEHVDHSPVFDPDGRFLFFLSARGFDPVPDAIFHDYGFPRATIPMAIPLAAATPSPFDVAQRGPRAPGATGEAAPPAGGESVTTIDLEGLADRVVAFPVPLGVYSSLRSARGRVLFSSRPTGGDKSIVQAWDFAADKLDTVAEGVKAFTLSADRKVLALLFGQKLRVVPSGWKDEKNGREGFSRETGWIDLDRIQLEVVPGAEWRQMFDEAWRLQRDYFWSEDMSGIDWVEVRERYRSLVDRVASRAEFSDLLWEMQGELGTSHAYELGGEYRPEPAWTQGMLGADLEWQRGAWRIASIPRGDSWATASPLTAPGVLARVGDRLTHIDGEPLGSSTPPESRLVHRAGKPVEMTLARGRSKPRKVVVTPLASETELRYREWVTANRARVRDASEGRLGYIHIPDMGVAGFAEFHRGFRSEVDLDGLVIDVRFNRGGNVSQILLERLLRKRLGFRVTRWREMAPFPYDSPAGPMVCLTNEMAGSDGDIFSHTFKQHGLGPLIGTRTWGGVVGIWPQQSLVDGTVTTQPEFSLWFMDVGYQLENFGTVPDIEVEMSPDDYRQGRDPQLERGISELMRLVGDVSRGVVPVRRT